MKYVNLILVILVLLMINGCSEKLTEPMGSFSISGKVISKGQPVNGAEISISNYTKHQTQTGYLGLFQFQNVPEGNSILKVFFGYPDSGCVEKTTSINVSENITLNDLSLPSGVHLISPDSINDSTIRLKWTSIDVANFTEYRVYQQLTSEVDYKTGTLIHTSSNVNDTTFNVTGLNPLSIYYFRIYAIDESGLIVSSNVVSTPITQVSLIKNGSFENLNPETGYPYFWQPYFSAAGYYFVDSLITEDGNYSIRIENAPGVNYYFQWVNSQYFIPGGHYKLTYWIKHDAMESGDEYAVFIDNKESTLHMIVNTVSGPQPASDWQMYEYNFTVPNGNTSAYSFGFYFYLYGNNKKAWLDNVSLIKLG